MAVSMEVCNEETVVSNVAAVPVMVTVMASKPSMARLKALASVCNTDTLDTPVIVAEVAVAVCEPEPPSARPVAADVTAEANSSPLASNLLKKISMLRPSAAAKLIPVASSPVSSATIPV